MIVQIEYGIVSLPRMCVAYVWVCVARVGAESLAAAFSPTVAGCCRRRTARGVVHLLCTLLHDDIAIQSSAFIVKFRVNDNGQCLVCSSAHRVRCLAL